jgi:hypothetical protein
MSDTPYIILPSECVLCHIPYNIQRIFPCNCSLPIHESCANHIRRNGSFTCPSCMMTYMFPTHTPATSVMGDSIIYPISTPRTRSEIACRRGKKDIYWIMVVCFLLILVGICFYLFLKYF